jgi:hypothetical protein
MKEYDLSVCFVPSCENPSVGQLVFIGAKSGTGEQSWFSEITICADHADAFTSDEDGVLPAYVTNQ